MLHNEKYSKGVEGLFYLNVAFCGVARYPYMEKTYHGKKFHFDYGESISFTRRGITIIFVNEKTGCFQKYRAGFGIFEICND